MTRTLPPVELTPVDLASARVSLSRLAHNALAVALLASRNAPRPGVHQQAPNSGSRVSTPGGSEQQSIEVLQARITEAEARHALAKPDSKEQVMYAEQLDRMDAHMVALRAQLDALPGGDRVYPGLRDTYTVTVPALHARIGAVTHISDLTRLTVAVNPETPRYVEYLGRGEWTGHQAEGRWPLWIVRGNKRGLESARGSEDWHADLFKLLWSSTPLPELYAQRIEQNEAPENDGTAALVPEVTG